MTDSWSLVPSFLFFCFSFLVKSKTRPVIHPASNVVNWCLRRKLWESSVAVVNWFCFLFSTSTFSDSDLASRICHFYCAWDSSCKWLTSGVWWFITFVVLDICLMFTTEIYHVLIYECLIWLSGNVPKSYRDACVFSTILWLAETKCSKEKNKRNYAAQLSKVDHVCPKPIARMQLDDTFQGISHLDYSGCDKCRSKKKKQRSLSSSPRSQVSLVLPNPSCKARTLLLHLALLLLYTFKTVPSHAFFLLS